MTLYVLPSNYNNVVMHTGPVPIPEIVIAVVDTTVVTTIAVTVIERGTETERGIETGTGTEIERR